VGRRISAGREPASELRGEKKGHREARARGQGARPVAQPVWIAYAPDHGDVVRLARSADRGLGTRADCRPPWSPDHGCFADGSIASCDRWLKAGNEPGLRRLGTETIYRFIYRARQKLEKLWQLLPRGKARRGRRKRRETKSTITDRRSIHERPEAVLGREKLGDWEADLMFCRRTQPILVLHERTSRLTLAAKLAGKSAAETAATLMAIFKRLAPELKGSITFDNGSEFARHGLLASVSGMTTWFCDAYASWQKGSVENTNGRLRRQLPKHLDLDTLSQADLQEILLSLNLTPRKCLGYATPIQAFFKGLGKDIRIRFA